MKCAVKNMDNKEVGEIDLADEVFGIAEIRKDLLARMVNWQLAKRRAGTHKTKTISEIRGTTAKPWRQKGSGKARQGSLRSVGQTSLLSGTASPTGSWHSVVPLSLNSTRFTGRNFHE